ncbi:MAG: hypothetical protein J0M22_07835 [Gammaproteobacteria bacterium]|nr:hypothetical protein [Gammaproteobacteria bacterium]
MTTLLILVVVLGLMSIALPWWSKFNWYLVAVLMVPAFAIGWYVLSFNVEVVLGYFLPPADPFASAAEIMSDDAPDGFFWRDTLWRYGWLIGAGYASCLFVLSLFIKQRFAKTAIA